MAILLNPIGIYDVTIDISSREWSALLPTNIRDVIIVEETCKCDRYPDGVFPGGKRVNGELQEGMARRFSNYIEHTKVTADELSSKDSRLYLNARHYRKRSRGWATTRQVEKHGNVIAHCVNGKLYPNGDASVALRKIYGVTYRALIQDMPEIERLCCIVQEQYRVRLVGAEPLVLETIAEAVLDLVKQ